MDKRILQALNLSESATGNQVLTAITNLQNSKPKFSEDEFASLKRQVRLSHYEKQTQSLAVSGTPAELAEKLVNYEEKGGEELAASVLTEWQGLTIKAKESGLFSASLSPRAGDSNASFMEKVSKYQEEHPSVSRADAIVALMKQEPDLYREYSEGVKAGTGA